MKFVVFVLLGIIAYANANCGCLKCSKHVGLADEYIAEPKFCGPVKVLYRGAKLGDIRPAGGRRFGEFGPGLGEFGPGFPRNDDLLGYSRNGLGGFREFSPGTFPITVQKPIVVPENIPVCVPLTGLKACVDRVVLPAPEFRHLHKDGPAITYTSGPLLEALDIDDYRYNHRGHISNYGYGCGCGYDSFLNSFFFPSVHSAYIPKTRLKRQIPVVQHSYKFFMNMLPPFMKDHVQNAVNVMALTHPEQPKQKPRAKSKFLMIPPTFKQDIFHTKPKPLSLREKIMKNIRENKKPNVKSLFMKQNQKKHPRTEMTRDNEDMDDIYTDDWIREFKTSDILEKYSGDKFYSNFNEYGDDRTRKRYKHRSKRSIIMDSDDLSLPLYHVKFDDDPEDQYNTNEYEPYDEEEYVLQKKPIRYYHDPREEMLRRAIKEELRKFKKMEPKDQFGYNKMVPHSPIFHLLTFPLMFFKNIGNHKGSPLTAVPKMIVGTKKYFRDFGKNFKKHALDFASDIIGDFDHETVNNNLLDVFVPRRYKRHVTEENKKEDLVLAPSKKYEDEELQNRKKQFDKRNVQYIETDRTLKNDYSNNVENNINKGNFGDVSDSEDNASLDALVNEKKNFRNGSENKVRKKRYIVKVVDEDEVEEFLREKLGKIFNIGRQSNRQPQYIEERHSDEETWTLKETRNLYNKRKQYENGDRYPHKKVNVEKVRPKLIIDNNGLTFMEMNGFKRPIFMNKNTDNNNNNHANHFYDETVGSLLHFIPFDSSEEVSKDKIDHIIGYARKTNKMNSKNYDVPINTIKKKMSDLLYETDAMVHIDFWKYHDIYDDLLEIQYIKSSIIQDWKKIVMEKRINDYKAKVNLLGKFKSMQHIKDITVNNIVNVMYKESSNSFILGEFVKMLAKLHKLQCIINKVVSCFEEKFRMGTKFDMHNEIKFVDFLAKLNFAGEKTRNDMIAKLKEIRDNKLQINIKLLDKLKKSLIEEDESCIEEEANLIWEIKNIEKMRKRTIEEMHQKLMDGYRIKKHMKILFDLSKRLQICEKELRDECKKDENNSTEKEKSKEDESKSKSKKKFNREELKQKLQEKIEKYKEIMQVKKEKLKKKYKKDSIEDD